MGPTVTIDPLTGLISGTAPSTTGDYVVAVYAIEYRQVLGEAVRVERET
jgi:hypothetical protein